MWYTIVDMKKILLTQGKYALVDDTDFEFLNQWKWYYNKGYAIRHSSKDNSEKIYMHRLVNKTPDGLETDHINQDKIDNQRINLRTATRSQNGINKGLQLNNKSCFKGVCWNNYCKKWMVRIRVNNKLRHIGYYDNLEVAGLDYKIMACQLFGEFANMI